MSNDRLAFMIGLLGSIHCIGMCGPLAFAVPTRKQGWMWLLFDKFTYQLGRICAYCTLGLITGIIGTQLWMAGLQQGLSIFSGILILCAACSRIFRIQLLKMTPVFLLKPFHQLFHYALKHRANHLIIGAINGLLPCGFVYLAMAGALNTETTTKAISYMFWFGIGTSPLMFIATIGIGFTGSLLRKRINSIIPYFMLCLGIWFIFRGLELNIPYLSPKPSGNIAECR